MRLVKEQLLTNKRKAERGAMEEDVKVEVETSSGHDMVIC
jgi:hypothetical protein